MPEPRIDFRAHPCPLHRLLALILMNIFCRSAFWLIAALPLPLLDGCGVAAFPCRAVSATLKIVPAVGHAAAVPFDACASAID